MLHAEILWNFSSAEQLIFYIYTYFSERNKKSYVPS